MNQDHFAAPDVMIHGVNNIDVQRQQTALARQCQEVGLSIQFIVEDLSLPKGVVAEAYRYAGFDVAEIPCSTWRKGPLAYPSAPSLIRLLVYWKYALRGYRPRLLLTHSDRGGTWGVLQVWAKRSGVTTAVLQEGVSAQFRAGFKFSPTGNLRKVGSRLLRTFFRGLLDNRLGNYLYADHALVWGEATRRSLIAAGRSPSTVHVVGNPQFDNIKRIRQLAAQQLRTVLFAQQDQPNVDAEREACLHLVRICTDELKCHLLFRPHPRGRLSREVVMEMASSTTAPYLVEVADGPDIAEYLPRASVLATYYSAAAYHAALHGIPLLLLDWVSPIYRLDAPEYGAALSVEEPAALAPSLRRVLDDVDCRQSLFAGLGLWSLDHLGPLDGCSSQRAARVLRHLAEAS